MVKIEDVGTFALSFDYTDEHPHFEIVSFRVKKKVFLTLNKKENRVCIKLNLIDQDVFCKVNKGTIYPVPNTWGKHGWTLIDLKTVKKIIFKDAVTCAYCNVAPAKIAEKYLL